MKVEITAIAFVFLHHFVFADDYLSRCPEYNPQNELDIELVSSKEFLFFTIVIGRKMERKKFHAEFFCVRFI